MATWAQLTTMQQAFSYIAAERAEAEKYCSSAVSAYKIAEAQAASYLATQDSSSAAWTVLEGLLTTARNAWKTAGCTKVITADKDYVDPTDLGSAEGSSIWTWLLIAGGAGLVIYLIAKSRKK